jgi:hypothetical protein
MLSDLVNFGPLYFRQFKDQLCNPETVEAIPIIKTPILAARAMHVCNSTVSGNIRSVVELLQQGGIEDPADVADPDTDMPDICRVFAAAIVSWILSKNMRNFGGIGSLLLQPSGMRNAKSWYDESEYLIFRTHSLTLERSIDVLMVTRFSERI